jgi:hypothetical protein
LTLRRNGPVAHHGVDEDVRLLCENTRKYNAGGPIAMPHRPIHPVLRAGARETAQFWLQLIGYVGLLALFAMAAASLWLDLPAAIASLDIDSGALDRPLGLRGAL